MKFNITIDLDKAELNDYFDEGGNMSLSEAIKTDIKIQLKQQITRNINDMYAKKLMESIQTYVEGKVEKIIDNFYESDEPLKFHKEQFSKEHIEVSCKEFIKKTFIEEIERKCFRDSTINRIAEDFAQDLKKEYDKKFASKIVENMQKLDLLKDDKIVELLK